MAGYEPLIPRPVPRAVPAPEKPKPSFGGARAGRRSTDGARPGSDLAFLQRAFGADFSSVRIHRDGRADSAQAHALTEGEDIHLSPSLGAMGGDRAQRVLAHELGHVLQQRAGAAGFSTDTETRSETRADAAARAALRGTAIPPLGAAAPGAAQHKKKRSAPAGGGILYIGMNNYKPEAAAIDARYAGVDVNVTKVTVSETESAFPSAGKTFDLGTADGCHDFCNTLPINGEAVEACTKLLLAQSSSDRDDLAHVIQVYAETEDDGRDRMSRVVLSGHSYGTKVYNGDAKGAILFDALVKLGALFPRAAGQTRHLMVLACLAGEEQLVTNVYKKAFPNLVTFSGWTNSCPTGPGAVSALTEWLGLTDKDPRSNLPAPEAGRSNWVDGVFQGGNESDASLLSGLHADDAMFKSYFDGSKVDPDNHSGPLFDFYRRARIASNRLSIAGPDHAYVQKAADQSFRLRFWPGMVSHFWTANKTVLATAGVPDLSRMKRKEALAAIDAFLTSTAGGKGAGMVNALLQGLRDLDAVVLHDDWLEP